MWNSGVTSRAVGAALAAASLMAAASLSGAETQTSTVDRFTATTVSMTPAGLGLRIDVREWSDEESRSAVVAVLGGEADVASALSALPTLGYVWRSDSGVGYSVKYAHRVDTAEGERVTFVTDKRLGVHDFKPWTVDGGFDGEPLDYSVIELELPDTGTGDGMLSLAADVMIDQENALVSLEIPEDAPRLLTDAKIEPKPYWSEGS
jgi:hypothetical protein